MNKASYKYLVRFKYKGNPRIQAFITGYVPAGLKMSEIRKYIQGKAEDKKIIGLTKLEQKYYYPELEIDSAIDVTDSGLFEAQEALKETAIDD